MKKMTEMKEKAGKRRRKKASGVLPADTDRRK